LFLLRARKVARIVYPDEYALGVLLMLVPGWLLFLGKKVTRD